MSDLIVIQPQVTELTVTEDVNQVIVSSVGVQGPAGATGAKGDTGDQGPSGVIAVTAPITNSGTSTSANIGVSAGSTSNAGVLQLTDSISSTSTTTAATPNAVKTAFDSSLIKGTNLTRITGYYYRTPIAQFAGVSTINNTTFYTPIFIEQQTAFDRIAIFTGATFSGTGTVRLGIYNDTNGQPSTLILDAGTVSPTGPSQTQQITINQTLNTGFYWLAFCQQGTAPTTANYAGTFSANTISNPLVFAAATLNGALINGFQQSGVSGAFANAGTLTASGGTVYVWIRKS